MPRCAAQLPAGPCAALLHHEPCLVPLQLLHPKQRATPAPTRQGKTQRAAFGRHPPGQAGLDALQDNPLLRIGVWQHAAHTNEGAGEQRSWIADVGGPQGTGDRGDTCGSRASAGRGRKQGEQWLYGTCAGEKRRCARRGEARLPKVCACVRAIPTAALPPRVSKLSPKQLSRPNHEVCDACPAGSAPRRRRRAPL